MPSADAIADRYVAYHPPPVTMPPPPAPPSFSWGSLIPSNIRGAILNAVVPGYSLTTSFTNSLAPVAEKTPVAVLFEANKTVQSVAEGLATQITPVGNVLPVTQTPPAPPPPVTANVEKT